MEIARLPICDLLSTEGRARFRADKKQNPGSRANLQGVARWRSRDLDDSATRESPRYVCITPVVGRKREAQGEIHRLDSTPRINYESSEYISVSKHCKCVRDCKVPDTLRYSYVRIVRIREWMKEFMLGHTNQFVFNFKWETIETDVQYIIRYMYNNL